MTSLAHWTPRYAYDRLRSVVYGLSHPDTPWITPEATEVFERYLKHEHIGAEWGAGRSTRWIAERVAGLVSIEHDPDWYARVEKDLTKLTDHSVNMVLARGDGPGYLDPVKSLDDGILDFVLVDGIRRDECALIAVTKIKSGGIIVIDDAHRYLPSESRAPNALGNDTDAMDHNWKRFAKQTAAWEVTWTSDGLRDTAIYHKP